MTLNAQVKEVCQLVVSLGETPEYLHNSLNNMGVENKVEESNGRWNVYFKNESSSDDNILITHLEFEA
jgi:predicted Rossmann fold nucleotide-binding protein DprA/Smf involved in DNA uptake